MTEGGWFAPHIETVWPRAGRRAGELVVQPASWSNEVMESLDHRQLKDLALGWARGQGYSCAGLEVSLPNSGFRADVAAYRPGSELREIEGTQGRRRRIREAAVGTTAIFECKQSRADLLRDTAVAERARQKLRDLHGRREVLERLLRIHFPSLRTGDTLFPEYEALSPEASAHQGYQSVLRGIRMLQKAVTHRTKFERMMRYRCANLHYLVVAEGMLHASEIPAGWGLLEWHGARLEVIRLPAWVDSPPGARLGLLHRIAQGACRRVLADRPERGF